MLRERRILKGGDWGSKPYHLRPAFRGKTIPEISSAAYGIRLAVNRSAQTP
jgi:formylglycine-generating enzyme required for sulfatase activity